MSEEKKVYEDKIMKLVKENKPDGRVSEADVKAAIKSLKESMGGMNIGVASILARLNRPMRKGFGERKEIAKKPYEDKIMKVAKENNSKKSTAKKVGDMTGLPAGKLEKLKKGGKVKKQVKKKTGRLALRGYGISR